VMASGADAARQSETTTECISFFLNKQIVKRENGQKNTITNFDSYLAQDNINQLYVLL
jgi:hypothetical protein